MSVAVEMASPAPSPSEAPFRPARPPRGEKKKAAADATDASRRGRGGARAASRGGRPARPPRDAAAPAAGQNGASTAPAAQVNNGKKQKKQTPPKQPAGTKPNKRQDDAKLAQLKQLAGDYYPEEILSGALHDSHGDVEAAFNKLNAQKQSSWSSIVSKPQGAPLAKKVTPPPAEAPKPSAPAAGSAPVAPKVKKTPVAAPETTVDPEVKAAALAKQLDETFRETESKALALKTFKSDLEAISAPRDAEVAKLAQEKQERITRNQAIREELAGNETRIREIDQEIERLKKEKASQIAALEAKAKAVLVDPKPKKQ